MQGLLTIEILRVSHLYQPTYTRLREHWRKVGRKNARFQGWKRELQYSLGYGMTGTLKLFFLVMISTRPARDQVNKKVPVCVRECLLRPLPSLRSYWQLIAARGGRIIFLCRKYPSLVSVALINTKNKNNFGEEDVFHLTDYSPSQRKVNARSQVMSVKQKPGRNIAY